jgi:hypothetical protein
MQRFSEESLSNFSNAMTVAVAGDDRLLGDVLTREHRLKMLPRPPF